MPHPVYAIIGYGLRLAQDLGAHRRTTYGPKPTVEDELKKRAFWCVPVRYFLPMIDPYAQVFGRYGPGYVLRPWAPV